MNKQMYRNTGPAAVYIGGKCVPAGETREVLIPRPHVKAAAQESAADPEPMGGLVQNTIAQITAGFANLSDADLVTLARLEEAKASPRATLLSALAAEQLRRAGQEDES